MRPTSSIASLGLVACSTLSGDPVSVVRSVEEVPDRCELVGPLGIGFGLSDEGEAPEALEPELAAWATRIARDWDADVLVFRTVVEKRPESAEHPSLSCDCQAYRCAGDPPETAKPVPLVALLANPDAYEGQLVEVTAWAAVEYELAALFLKPEDKSHIAFESAIHLAGPESLYSKLELPHHGYLRVVGRFSKKSPRNMYGGQIGVHRLGKVEPYDPNGGLTEDDSHLSCVEQNP